MSEKIPLTDGQQGNGVDQHTLSPREQEILGLLLDGMSLKEIASKLGVSYKAVDYHRGNLYRKFGIQSMQELLVMYSTNKKEFARYISKTKNREFVQGLFNWTTYKNELSSIDFSLETEVMEGQTFATYNLYGNVSSDSKEDGFAGIFGYTITAMKSVSSFSFNVLGDGKEYMVLLVTEDTRNSNDHYFKPFPTIKDEIMTVTMNMDEFTQLPSNNPVKFIQENIFGLQFQSFKTGQFKLKVWDIRLYP